jgi:RNA polymerase sigma-70 factor (ECF subfamily)
LLESPLLRVEQTSDYGSKPGSQSDAGSDADLIGRTLSGDESAFRVLVERYQAQVAATVIGILGSGTEAEDAGQETFIRLFRSLSRIRGESSLGTYVTRIAINLSLDAARRRHRRRFWLRIDDEDEALPEALIVESGQNAESNERRERVQRAVRALDPKHRAVVVLRMIRGFSTKETAVLLGIPAGTVLSRLPGHKRSCGLCCSP